MADLRQAAQMALEVFADHFAKHGERGEMPLHLFIAHSKLREALAAAQEPVAWVRAVDEAMVTHHIGTAEPSDDYETAVRKLNSLLCHAQSIGEYFAKQAAQPLTDEQIAKAAGWDRLSPTELAFARAIERAHGIGGTNAG